MGEPNKKNSGYMIDWQALGDQYQQQLQAVDQHFKGVLSNIEQTIQNSKNLDAVADAQVAKQPLLMQTPEAAKKYRDIAELQTALKALKYNLGTSGKNKDGVDGMMGRRTKEALADALKKGYVLHGNKLLTKEEFDAMKAKEAQTLQLTSTNRSMSGGNRATANPGKYSLAGAVEATPVTSKQLPSNEDPSFASNFFNYAGRHIPIVRLFVDAPYEGTEEEARKLGYKTYTTNGFSRHNVDYSVPGLENMTPQQRALALLDTYGITTELTRDKSPVSTLAYEYAPGYGYNFLRMGENIIRGNKVRSDGKANKETITTPVADKMTSYIADFADLVGADGFASDLRESNTYNINESALRNDLSNLYFGYPMLGKSLRVSKKTETGGGHTPELGYFMEFTNDSHIYGDPAYKKASVGNNTTATGENMGTWSASVDAKGKKAYYDKWDINPLTHIPGLEGLPNMDFLGTGFELYGKLR